MKAIQRRSELNNDSTDKNGNDFSEYHTSTIENLRKRYLDIKRIGQGSFGRVLKAYDKIQKIEVAIKIQVKSKPGMVELNTLQSIKRNHANCTTDSYRNVVDYYTAFLIDNNIYIVLELVDMDLSTFMKERGKNMSENEIQCILKSILQGLQFLQTSDIIHCDIKPANIGVNYSSGNKRIICKIFDFSVSLTLEKAGPSHFAVQAPAYRAPEVFLGAPFDYKIDIWSFGCISVLLKSSKYIFKGWVERRRMMSYIELFGLPPDYIIKSGVKSRLFFDITENKITLRNSGIDQPCIPCSTKLEDATGIYDDDLYLDFLRQCFKMCPNERSSASQLLSHSYIKQDAEPVTRCLTCYSRCILL